MIRKITENVFMISFPNVHSCNSYFIKDKNILIDTGSRDVFRPLQKILPIPTSEIDYVFFTHLHFDHFACFDLFYNAELFASDISIKSLKDQPNETVYDIETIKRYKEDINKLQPYSKELLKRYGFEIIKTPGHTKGSVCLLYKDENNKIMFSGDTIFDTEFKIIGRTDLPTSLPKEMPVTLRKLSSYDYDILCPGHGKFFRK